MTPRIVLVTAPGASDAQRLAELILRAHLAACVNILPKVESYYWWQGCLEQASEVLMLIKSSAELFDELAHLVQENHPYECPEIVAIDPLEMAPTYRSWWEEQLIHPSKSAND